jgi:hypothetical protein
MGLPITGQVGESSLLYSNNINIYIRYCQHYNLVSLAFYVGMC